LPFYFNFSPTINCLDRPHVSDNRRLPDRREYRFDIRPTVNEAALPRATTRVAVLGEALRVVLSVRSAQLALDGLQHRFALPSAPWTPDANLSVIFRSKVE
jgi:hypothetical protein